MTVNPVPIISSPLEDLAKNLSKQVQALAAYLDDAKHPQPSFDRSTPTTVLPDDAPKQAHSVRDRVLDCALKIFQLAAGPSEYLANLQTGYHYVACLQYLTHFQVLAHIPPSGTISYTDLATLTSLPESRLKAVIRMAITNGILAEPFPQQVAHSATSALLATDQNYADWASFLCDYSAPTAAAMAAAQRRWPTGMDKTEAAYHVAFDTRMPFFEHLATVPERQKQFGGYMRAVTSSQGTAVKHLVEGFDWAGLGEALVVDVGGSTGHASIALAQAFPNLSFVVEDLPDVVAGGPQTLAEAATHPSALAARIKFLPQDIFAPQAVHGADVYLLRMILHDWNAEDSVKILSNILPALKKGARIIVMDTVLPAPGTLPAARERLLRVRDLTMLQVFNAGERATEDWSDIFARVDARLKCRSVCQPFGSVMSLMELVLEEK